MNIEGYTQKSVYENSHAFQMDCMEALKQIPDKWFDLAVVDPPYGLGMDGQSKSTSKHGGRRYIEKKGWDLNGPSETYFSELFRVSKNQIIWGANYFTKHIPKSMGWVFWDKGQRISNSDGELAFTSFEKALRVVEINRSYIAAQGLIGHPTQKPVALYQWLLKNYAKPGDKILDTHLGSASSRIAAYKMGFEFWGFEIDQDYFNQADERFRNSAAMPLFDSAPAPVQMTIEL